MIRFCGLAICFLLTWSLQQAASSPIVIDDFQSGAIVDGPGTVAIYEPQTGLPEQSVIGGARHVHAFYAGELAIASPPFDGLAFRFDGFFEVIIFRYGAGFDSNSPLNMNFRLGDQPQLVVDVKESYVENANGLFKPTLRFILDSGFGTASYTRADIVIPLQESSLPYRIEIPLSKFADIDLADVDSFYLQIFSSQNSSFVIDRIAVEARLPGDFNGDHFVDAADYTVWRDSNGTREEYELWKAHFGDVAGEEAKVGDGKRVVPEPGLLSLLASCLISSLRARASKVCS